MQIGDIISVFTWWFTILIIGIGFLPITSSIFNRFFDKGYIFSKVLGIALISYGIFLFSLLHILPFTQLSTYLVFCLEIVIFFLVIKEKKSLLKNLLLRKKIFLFEESLFLIALCAWVEVKSFGPDIHGLEKFMDFGFINSIVKTTYFPPRDMWFSPMSINYYYFGHLVTGVLTKLSGLTPNITFNLMISTIFAFCFTEAFSIGSNLSVLFQESEHVSFLKRFISGTLSATLVSLSGNLHIFYSFFKPYATDTPVPFWKLSFTPVSFPNGYWYPNATRFIYHTIHEFPIYSWVVSDLHGHVLDIPFVLFVIGLLLVIYIAPKENKKQPQIPLLSNKLSYLNSFLVIPIQHLLLLGFFISILYMTNAWDGAIYLLLASCLFFVIAFEKKSQTGESRKEFFIPVWITILIRNVIATILFTLFTFIIFSLPYNLSFKPFVYGVGIMCSPSFLTSFGHLGPFLFEPNHCEHSMWWQLVTLYGFFYFFIFSLLYILFWKKYISRIDIFILTLIAFATFLIFLPEFIYIKDIYPTYFRANTMFKLIFQAFIILSLVSAYSIVRIIGDREKRRRIMRFIFFFPISVILLTLVFTYPFFAIKSYYGELKTQHRLDGTVYLQTLYPTDYQGILWLNEHIHGQPVILEAQGDSYTDFARVSSNTGLPTILGWTVHEWLWRGSYDIPAPRITDIQTLYQSNDRATTKALITKYHVKLVFIGTLEYQKYPTLNEEKFAKLGKIIYKNGLTKIYELY